MRKTSNKHVHYKSIYMLETTYITLNLKLENNKTMVTKKSSLKILTIP